MSGVVTVSVDSAGRLVLPEPIREQAGLKPGVPFEVAVVDGRVEMRPATASVRIVRKGRLSVAVSTVDLPPLTEQEVLAVRDELRGRRSGS